MAKKPLAGFDDPLSDIDPVMEQAFSVNEPDKNEENEISFPDNSEMDQDSPESTLLQEEEEPTPDIAQIKFPELNEEDEQTTSIEEGVFSNIPVKVSVELGRCKLSLKEVYELSEGSIIELERLVGEPLDLVVNGQVIAQGEVVAIDNKYGLRIKNLISNPKK